jgi:hypothetical protein
VAIGGHATVWPAAKTLKLSGGGGEECFGVADAARPTDRAIERDRAGELVVGSRVSASRTAAPWRTYASADLARSPRG